MDLLKALAWEIAHPLSEPVKVEFTEYDLALAHVYGVDLTK